MFTNKQNQKILGSKDKVRIYLDLMSIYPKNIPIFDKGCSLLCNLIYKNLPGIPILLSQETEKKAIGLFEGM